MPRCATPRCATPRCAAPRCCPAPRRSAALMMTTWFQRKTRTTPTICLQRQRQMQRRAPCCHFQSGLSSSSPRCHRHHYRFRGAQHHRRLRTRAQRAGGEQGPGLPVAEIARVGGGGGGEANACTHWSEKGKRRASVVFKLAVLRYVERQALGHKS